VEMHTASLYLNLVLVVCITEIFFTLTNQYFIIRDYYMTFSILALVLARGLMVWVEG
jgi:hypothetical protein